MRGHYTRAIISCLKDEDSVDMNAFYKLIPNNQSTFNALITLKDQGYLVLDCGDNTITNIAITAKLRKLIQA